MRHLRKFAPAVALVLALGVPATNAAADAPLATSGGATSVTSTSAILNGAIGLTLLGPASWTFQWGTTNGYGHTTTVTPLAGNAGLFAVGATITGLKPGTRYHFRLVVGQFISALLWGLGTDLTFVTPRQSGYASLVAHRLLVRSGTVTVPLTCTGPRGARCSGPVTLTAHHQLCGGGNVYLRAGSSQIERWPVSKGCRSQLLRARQHRVDGALNGAFAGQRPLRVGVSLTLG